MGKREKEERTRREEGKNVEGRNEEEEEGRKEIPGRHIVWALPSSLPGTILCLKSVTMDSQIKLLHYRTWHLCPVCYFRFSGGAQGEFW